MSNDVKNATTANILVVDDTAANLHLLVKLLTNRGYKVRPVPNGHLALSGARGLPPDLILLDIMMPEMDGYEVCRKLKANPDTRDIPIIFISAIHEVIDKVKAFSLGGVDYITKPFEAKEVLARVETHLALRNMQKKLQEKNELLEKTLQDLKTTQSQLIEAEKMASLGSLVAGVAHEINTPVGNGLIAASTLANETKFFAADFEVGKLKRSSLKAYLDKAGHCSELILRNLHRAGELVVSFKQVAVDQSSLEKRVFQVKEYLEKTILSLEPQLKQTEHSLTVGGDETLMMDSYPGALSQVATNLVMNSIAHAYPSGGGGHLQFRVSRQSDRATIEYNDDGCGIPEKNLGKIFDPFFTTARSQGGSGLGLHIVYNLVSQKLQGQIRCESEVGLGTKFILDLPISISSGGAR
ncbi:MAG: response regulator [Oscillatoria sp. SIO1A7]|nr:response regulator [Oscillatoria sp. SIO1A7]